MGFIKQAYTYLRSVTSGQASPEIVAQRVNSCYAPCSELLRTRKGDFCRACGCGMKPEAELHNKLNYACLECPLKKPGFSNS